MSRRRRDRHEGEDVVGSVGRHRDDLWSNTRCFA